MRRRSSRELRDSIQDLLKTNIIFGIYLLSICTFIQLHTITIVFRVIKMLLCIISTSRGMCDNILHDIMYNLDTSSLIICDIVHISIPRDIRDDIVHYLDILRYVQQTLNIVWTSQGVLTMIMCTMISTSRDD